MSVVDLYSIGVVHVSVCYPSEMALDDVTTEVNRQSPTGITSPWRPSLEKQFKTGQDNPCRCDRGPGRTHRLFAC